jgi:serine/threonine protein kinase
VAHAAGVVHRDVKPGNVLIGDDGVVRITDFGIAWSASSVPLTLTGQVVGTPHYLPPEQASGQKACPAGDVYALGLIGYECLAGRRAFDGDNAVAIALRQVREEPEPLPPDVPDDVRTLIGRALLKDPAERYPDGAAFRNAIEDVQAGRPLPPLTEARPPGPSGWPAWASTRRTVRLPRGGWRGSWSRSPHWWRVPASPWRACTSWGHRSAHRRPPPAPPRRRGSWSSRPTTSGDRSRRWRRSCSRSVYASSAWRSRPCWPRPAR